MQERWEQMSIVTLHLCRIIQEHLRVLPSVVLGLAWILRTFITDLYLHHQMYESKNFSFVAPSVELPSIGL